MTIVYFIRHAEPDFSNHDDRTRGLSHKGMADREKVTEYLRDKRIDAVLSSPYLRAVQTVEHFAESAGLEVSLHESFRERRITDRWIEDFPEFCRRQWENFAYKYPDGENLYEVQSRNISALNEVLRQYRGKNVVIGTHGTSLGSIINFYDTKYDFDDFNRLRPKMPYGVKMIFHGFNLVAKEEFEII